MWQQSEGRCWWFCICNFSSSKFKSGITFKIDCSATIELSAGSDSYGESLFDEGMELCYQITASSNAKFDLTRCLFYRFRF